MQILFILFFSFTCIVSGQIEPANGLRENPPKVWALNSATVYIEPGVMLEDATIIIRDGLIEKVGRNILIPNDATNIDMFGKTIYDPRFIEGKIGFST